MARAAPADICAAPTTLLPIGTGTPARPWLEEGRSFLRFMAYLRTGKLAIVASPIPTNRRVRAGADKIGKDGTIAKHATWTLSGNNAPGQPRHARVTASQSAPTHPFVARFAHAGHSRTITESRALRLNSIQSDLSGCGPVCSPVWTTHEYMSKDVRAAGTSLSGCRAPTGHLTPSAHAPGTSHAAMRSATVHFVPYRPQGTFPRHSRMNKTGTDSPALAYRARQTDSHASQPLKATERQRPNPPGASRRGARRAGGRGRAQPRRRRTGSRSSSAGTCPARGSAASPRGTTGGNRGRPA